ncbi:hypothetical protein ABBQ32_002216 [Trebouxia sp. C0010 RCD-2024]
MTTAGSVHTAEAWKQKTPYLAPTANENFDAQYAASCLCGEVQYAVDSDPVAAKFCHCTSCQILHGAPFQWAALFHKKNIRFIRGVDCLMFFHSEDLTPRHALPCKVSCSKCHSPIADEGRNMWMSFPTLFKFPARKTPDAFKPSCHIFYEQRCVDIKDGKTKWSKHQDESEIIPED